MTEFKVEPCEACEADVIQTVTERGREIAVNAEPVLGGKFALREVHSTMAIRPIAVVPAPKFAFGRRLYVEHTGCAASTHKRGGA